jgi:tRNA (cytidine/uridine-2'-O-)-methyltransferase
VPQDQIRYQKSGVRCQACQRKCYAGGLIPDPRQLISDLRLALFEPDIPQNSGTILRLAACVGIGVDLIEPLGFALGDRSLRRAGLDYLEHAAMTRHASFAAFDAARRAAGRRLVLFSTKASDPYTGFAFRGSDVLLFGRESGGVTPSVRAAADAALRIPLLPERRSLNVAVAAAMALGEALRQTGGFPKTPAPR